MAKLKDFVNVSRKWFIDYYDRCITLGIKVCDDAIFHIGNYDNIGVDLVGVNEECTVVPPFVNYIYKSDLKHPRVNDNIKSLDLNNVNSISEDGLSEFVELVDVKGEKLEGIGARAFYGCTKLTEVDFPHVKSIADHAFLCCIHLSAIDLPELQYTRSAWCNYSYLHKIHAPKLIRLSSMEFYSHMIVEVVCGKNTIIERQPEYLKFKVGDNIYTWFGCASDEYFTDEDLKIFGVRRNKHGAYITYGRFLDNIKGVYDD